MDVVCLDFLNSEWHDFRGRWIRDYLQESEWLEKFLVRWNLQVESSPDTATVAGLTELRTLMRHIVEALPGGQASDKDLAALNAILRQAPSIRHVAREGAEYHLELIPLEKGWNWVMAEIAASFAELLTEYDPQRIKICENPSCGWIFYDESKSRTRRWCMNSKCGNLWKMRRFRARHKDDGQAANLL